MSSPARRAAIVAGIVGAALVWGELASADAPLTPTKYTIPSGGSVPTGITAGSDGNLWFTESADGKIGRITPAGTITEPSGATGLPGPTPGGPAGREQTDPGRGGIWAILLTLVSSRWHSWLSQ